jgi:hypothetical protein
MIDGVYYSRMGAARTLKADERRGSLSAEMEQFVDHLADLLAEEFAAALLKEEGDAGSDLREVLEREPTGAEHRGSGPRLQAVREP